MKRCSSWGGLNTGSLNENLLNEQVSTDWKNRNYTENSFSVTKEDNFFFFFFLNGNTEQVQCALSQVCIP